MEYRVSLTARTARDLELIYEFIQADTSDNAFTWFNDLVATIQSLERYPERGSIVPENIGSCYSAKSPTFTELSTRSPNASEPY
jgi:plasmid stabilization system protein ParE